MPPAVGRRHLLGTSISAAGVIALSACGSPPPKPGPTRAGVPDAQEDVPVTPPEDLMREHGVLKRISLIYREGIRRLQADEQDPSQALNASAGIIRSFIEDYHEHLEEQYVFPKFGTGRPTYRYHHRVARSAPARPRAHGSDAQCHRWSGCA
jgi:hypothetical protein